MADQDRGKSEVFVILRNHGQDGIFTDREIEKHRTRRYDGYYTEDGIWAMNAIVDLDNDEVIKCEWTQQETPFFTSLMKRYGSYKHEGAIFRSAAEALK